MIFNLYRKPYNKAEESVNQQSNFHVKSRLDKDPGSDDRVRKKLNSKIGECSYSYENNMDIEAEEIIRRRSNCCIFFLFFML